MLAAATTQMAVDEIRPGMVGIGRTVFDGTHVEEFKAHILGVLENVIGTQRNLILARLEGGPLANTGVIAGMSGSPVYIDGRLIGAVSYALGQFSKEPIAGITPIAEMTDATALGGARRPRRAGAARVSADARRAVGRVPQGAQLEPAVRRTPGRRDARRRHRRRRRRRRRAGHAAAADRDAAGDVGLRAGARRPVGGAFRDQGFVPTGGGVGRRRAGEMPYDGPLKPGDAVGVMLRQRRPPAGATGTVTHVDGDRVYAFGHPIYNLGPTSSR